MKKSLLTITVLALILCLTGSAMASMYTLRPTLGDLSNNAPLSVLDMEQSNIATDMWTGTYDRNLPDPLRYQNTVGEVAKNFGNIGLVNDFAVLSNNGVVGLGFDTDANFRNSNVGLTASIPAVPEAGTLGLLILGFGLLGGRRYIRKHRK